MGDSEVMLWIAVAITGLFMTGACIGVVIAIKDSRNNPARVEDQ